MGTVCSHCRHPLTVAEAYCPRCALMVRWEGTRATPFYPEIRAGRELLGIDLARERPPGMAEGPVVVPGCARGTQHDAGLWFEIVAGKAFESSIPFLRSRDQCARAVFI